MGDERSGSSFGAGVALAIGLVLASVIGGWAFVKGKRGDQTITVTGSARKRIKSDLVIWKAGVSYQAPVLADAYRWHERHLVTGQRHYGRSQSGLRLIDLTG